MEETEGATEEEIEGALERGRVIMGEAASDGDTTDVIMITSQILEL